MILTFLIKYRIKIKIKQRNSKLLVFKLIHKEGYSVLDWNEVSHSVWMHGWLAEWHLSKCNNFDELFVSDR